MKRGDSCSFVVLNHKTIKMKTLLNTLALSLFLLATIAVKGQDFTQTIRGQVIDQETQTSLPGATVLLMGTDPVVGTTTDMDGNFRIEGVPVGRVSLQISFIGYAPSTLNNLSLSSGKELVITVELDEQVITTSEFVVTATQQKTEALNEMSTVSVRTFSIEESQRFAGARNDVGRMASNFAGVSSANDAVNDIVIRGNSPTGLLWRLEGIDIPNPNHFGEGGSTGGPVSILNNNVLSNSDFFTGAFPAEYGNALSGAFDLKMRNGNNEQHEFLGQIGFNGFEFGAEGPLSKNGKGSYLINYRYSTVGFMQSMGLDVGTGSAVPDFQDVSFKMNLPTKKAGTFTLFGVGGISSIDFLDSEADSTDSQNLYTGASTDVYSKTRMGTVGLRHTYIINKTTYSKVTLAASGHLNRYVVDSISPENNDIIDFYRLNFEQQHYTLNALVNKKFNKQHSLRIGGSVKHMDFTMIDSFYVASLGNFETSTDFTGNTQLHQPYAQWKFKVNNDVTLNTGVHYSYLALNGTDNIEPRAGLKWKFGGNKSLSFGYGLHSQMASIDLYFRQIRLADGTYLETNRELDLTKSHHYVVGYDWNFSENKRLKIETYYQSIFDAVVEAQPSSYSLLNRASFGLAPPDSLVNGGTGYNYGAELTLEQFLNKGFYYLGTVSVFQSKYKGSDGVERNTAFNGNYVVNLLAGKEWPVGTKKEAPKYKKTFSIDGKTTLAGGQRYTPVNMEESISNGETVYEHDLAFSEQFKDYFRADIRFGFKLSSKKTDQEWVIDIQNVTDNENPLFQQVNLAQGTVETANQLGIFPMLQYRITF
jgi:hypothetical protein